MAISSPLPPALEEERTSRLARMTTVTPTPRPAPPPRQPLPPGGSAKAKIKARTMAKKGLRRAFEIAGGLSLLERMAQLEFEVGEQRHQIEVLRAQIVDTELRRAEFDHARMDVEGNRINLELLKGELRQLQHTLEELGRAFAPGTGLDGAGNRFAELREAVNSLERQLRNLSIRDSLPNSQPEAVPSDATPDAMTAAPTSTLFNYVGFERRFRGDPDEINHTLLERYGSRLSTHQPVVDIGCGRGELLGALSEQGVEVIGVEPDPGMVAETRARGVKVHQALAGEYLRSVPDDSLGSIITTHVAEHLPLDELIEMLELSVRKLRPGGVFISETPNPASLIVLGNSYILDPTHVWPLHPSLFGFLCETAGFRAIDFEFFNPAMDLQLAAIELPDNSPEWAQKSVDQVNTALTKLNNVLFGAQDYAIIATAPST